MSDLSIEMKEYTFQAAVQAAAKRASESCGSPEECAASVAAAAFKQQRASGCRLFLTPLDCLQPQLM